MLVRTIQLEMKTDDVPREKTSVGGDVGCGGWHRTYTRRADCTRADTGSADAQEGCEGTVSPETAPSPSNRKSGLHQRVFTREGECRGGGVLRRQKVGNHCPSHRCFKGFATSGDQPSLHFKTETNTPRGQPSTSSINHLQRRHTKD